MNVEHACDKKMQETADTYLFQENADTGLLMQLEPTHLGEASIQDHQQFLLQQILQLECQAQKMAKN